MIALLLCLLALIIISGFFSGSETGMMALNRYRIQHLAKKQKRYAIRILNLLKRPDRILGVILIGNTFANILASSLATVLTLDYFGEKYLPLATIILTLVILIFAEIAPKTVAALHPESTARWVSLPLRYLLFICYPLVWCVNGIANAFLHLFRVKVKQQNIAPLSSEEMQSIIYSSSGSTPAQENAMLMGVFDLKNVAVNHIMVPKHEIQAINLADPIEKIIQQIKAMQHTRIPLYRHHLDNIVGILHLRRAISQLIKPDLSTNQLLQASTPPYFIPEGTPLTQQLLSFQHNKERLALVVDEYGELQGLVTLDDILEEIVGEFTTDISDSNKDVHPFKDGSYRINASITIRELNRELKLALPTHGPATLNGLILEYLETIPSNKLSVRLYGYPMEILQTQGNRIKTVKIMPKLKTDPSQP